MDSRLLELTGNELTVVVVACLPKSMGIIELLGFHAQGAVPDACLEPDVSLVLQVELADRGLLNLSEIAIRFRSLTELLDDFVLLVIYFKQREREPFEARTALALSETATHRLISFFVPLLPLERFTTHVKFSCSEAVVDIIRGARKVVGLTNSINAWRQHNTKYGYNYCPSSAAAVWRLMQILR